MRFHYINRQEIAGFAGKTVELRHLPSGDAVLDLSVATTNSYKDRDGQWHDTTEWHSCIFYRQLAEDAAELLTSGAPVHIIGRTATREWEATDKSKRKRKEVIVESFRALHHLRTERDVAKDGATPADPPDGATPPSGSMAGFDTA